MHSKSIAIQNAFTYVCLSSIYFNRRSIALSHHNLVVVSVIFGIQRFNTIPIV